jgi:hypothetical protein
MQKNDAEKAYQTILLVGNCGSGKTWVMKQILAGLTTKPMMFGLFKFRYDVQRRIAVMGVYDGSTFEGTDRMTMTIMLDLDKLKKAQSQHRFTILAEGDRFTNSKFINGMKPTIIKIADDGAHGRSLRHSTQTERHIRAIASRIAKVNETYLVPDSNAAYELIKQITR